MSVFKALAYALAVTLVSFVLLGVIHGFQVVLAARWDYVGTFVVAFLILWIFGGEGNRRAG
jgi:hypothetical protein